jgi:signal peptidase II
MKRFIVTFAVVANLCFADAVVKELAAGLLKGSAAVSAIPGFFNLAYVENRGCAWGMFQGAVWPLAAFGVAALALLVWKRRAVFGDAWVAPCLIYAGIAGNLVDRVFRGYVIDMFDFHWGVHHFPCFNLADVYICVAAGLLVLDSFLPRKGGKSA